ncbi:MAG: hypothetical protein JWQ32_3646 [Marmoricola sp.]|nr:hypothetical protein [Marmoricola sp.]
MFQTRSRSLAAIAVGALLIAPLAGCGSDKAKGTAATPNASVSGSPTATATATSTPTGAGASATVTGASLDINQFVTDVTAAMRAKGTAHMVMEIGSSASAQADVDYRHGTAMRLVMTTGSQKVDIVLTGGVMYLQQTAGGKYLKIGKNDPSLGSLLTQLSNVGPTASLLSMKSGIKKILDVGTETIDGVQVTHYVVTVDTAKAAAAFGAASNALGSGQPATITYDMYLDSGKLLRQIDMTVGGQKIDMKVSDWGKSVSISAPPASQIIAH